VSGTICPIPRKRKNHASEEPSLAFLAGDALRLAVGLFQTNQQWEIGEAHCEFVGASLQRYRVIGANQRMTKEFAAESDVRNATTRRSFARRLGVIGASDDSFVRIRLAVARFPFSFGRR
jgi:hypothetical protein